MVALGDLQQIVVETQLKAFAAPQSRVVGFWQFSHLNVLDVALEDHGVDAQASALVRFDVRGILLL